MNNKTQQKSIHRCKPVFFLNLMRRQWPNGKVMALGSEGSRLETRNHRALGPLHQSPGPNAPPLVWHGSLSEGVQARCRTRHLTELQNYELQSKIALVLLQNGTFI
ncbi:hypothetical protein AVEN_22635-1 [Araneus ventricosus]|uniref:Uncharacterized protein n=1 Tax=Araneus ventricosus TaxID=182803 RepID=A0A4Y2JJK7_ARAVE|nr:hypothetical protein AVEN_22635-1 [Araneus ventricosus]